VQRAHYPAQSLFFDAGATLCASPAEVARNADAIFSIVGYPKDVEEVMLGADGVLDGESSLLIFKRS